MSIQQALLKAFPEITVANLSDGAVEVTLLTGGQFTFIPGPTGWMLRQGAGPDMNSGVSAASAKRITAYLDKNFLRTASLVLAPPVKGQPARPKTAAVQFTARGRVAPITQEQETQATKTSIVWPAATPARSTKVGRMARRMLGSGSAH